MTDERPAEIADGEPEPAPMSGVVGDSAPAAKPATPSTPDAAPANEDRWWERVPGW